MALCVCVGAAETGAECVAGKAADSWGCECGCVEMVSLTHPSEVRRHELQLRAIGPVGSTPAWVCGAYVMCWMYGEVQGFDA
jgi:hypothetical protein